MHGMVLGPGHMCSRGLTSLASVGGDEFNPMETWYPREEVGVGGQEGEHPLRGGVKEAGGWGKEFGEGDQEGRQLLECK